MPDPDGPRIATLLPRAISTSIPLRISVGASRVPRVRVTLRARIAISAAGSIDMLGDDTLA
ncbi:hypothetical protein [Sphingomonas koreensis]|uniref:hypothetical protein n=1 Tax=Sphingomonas koreensis TaxID=93064 RepID=UPI001F1783CF|nr:hypothetical protein [Sphingomonas koreensis]